MCHAIVEITWSGSKNRETCRCETVDALAVKLEQLKGSQECLEFRVFQTIGKFVRQTSWDERD